jgi:hypothetical protein
MAPSLNEFPPEELLSRSKFVDVHVDSKAGISSDKEVISVLLDSGGELEIIINKHVHDSSGLELRPGDPLYKVQPTGELRSARSCFQCIGCSYYFPLDAGKEIMMPEDEIRQLYKDGIINYQDLIPALTTYLAADDKPRRGFCEKCFKQERRRRILSAIGCCLVKPLKALFAGSEQPQASRPPIVFYHINRNPQNRPAFHEPELGHTNDQNADYNRRDL